MQIDFGCIGTCWNSERKAEITGQGSARIAGLNLWTRLKLKRSAVVGRAQPISSSLSMHICVIAPHCSHANLSLAMYCFVMLRALPMSPPPR